MSDITKCSGENCPIKEKCFRFTAETEPLWQSYFLEIPGKWREPDPKCEIVLGNLVWECDMFWGEKQENILKTLKDILE